MRIIDKFRKSLNRRLIVGIIVVQFFIILILGVGAYKTAKFAILKKSKSILKNSVVQALDLTKSEREKVDAGIISREESLENIKNTLAGPLNEDGTRTLHGNIDIGEHGYFIIVELDGVLAMHPTLEAQNVWEIQDYDDEEHYVIKELIRIGQSGGGYSSYSWHLPYSEKVGQKLSYVDYDPSWDWVVVATSYEIDFVAETRSLFLGLLFVLGISLLGASVYVIRLIKSITKPVVEVASGMEKIAEGEYKPIKIENVYDETKMLVYGFNTMVSSLEKANEDIGAKNEKLIYLAYNDELTKLPNRNAFKDFVNTRINTGCVLGYLVQMDILGLQSINSTLGYEQGDRLLKLFSDYLSQIEMENYFTARTGSNEFCIWIEGVEREFIHLFLNNFREDGKKYIVNHGYNQVVDLYVSMTCYNYDNKVFEYLYEEATTAMRIAKENNTLEISSFEPFMRQAVEDEINMRTYLENGITNNEFVVYYQEKVDYLTKKIMGVEALARWNSSRMGFVSPNVFIPYIKQFGIMRKFTRYIADRVCADYKDLVAKYGSEVSISINISPSCFMEVDFVDMISEKLIKYNIQPGKLILEITEDIFITDSNNAAEIVDRLHELGVKISFDDFGTGYSSLNYLLKIHPDEIKIDRSFVDRIIEDDNIFYVFETLCNLADNFGYDIVAEGVETQEQLDKIKSTSLRIIQGYIFSRPAPL